AEGELAAFGALLRPRHVLQQPGELGPGEVGVQQEARFPGEGGFMPLLSQSVTSGRGASVLPDDGVGHGSPGGPFPEESGLPLVRDADGDVRAGEPRLRERAGRHVALRAPYLQGIVLDPAGLWENLAEFLLCRG